MIPYTTNPSPTEITQNYFYARQHNMQSALYPSMLSPVRLSVIRVDQSKNG